MKLTSIFKSAMLSAAIFSCALQAKPVYVQQRQSLNIRALDAVRDGVKEVLNEKRFITVSSFKFTYESAQGSLPLRADST